MKNIAVFFGGKSVEHDISIITAMQALSNKPEGYAFIPIYILPEGKMVTGDNLFEKKIYLNFYKEALHVREVLIPAAKGEIWLLKGNKIKEKIKIDCALLCNHGHGGEDGSLQGLLELAEIAYTSCDVLSSSLCMDKVLSKVVFSQSNILTPKYAYISKDEFERNKDKFLKQVLSSISLPCIVKPANLGSSVGINICEDENMLNDLIMQAFQYDNKIIVEKFIQNAREFCCAVVKLDDSFIASKVSEVKKGKFYTFEEKYLSNDKDIKNDLSEAFIQKVKSKAISAYKALLCCGVVRVDFLLDGDNLYVNELNSIPGSLAFHLFNFPFSDLIACLIKEGMNRFNKKSEIVYKFNSQAISKYIEMSDNFRKTK